MFIAMNRFKVARGAESDFEELWLNRESHLNRMEGFVEFRMLKGPEREDHRLYASHTLWRSKQDFEAWTRSDAFRQAHGGARSTKTLYLGPPEFEGFETIQTIAASRD